MTIIFILLCIHALFAQVDASHYFTPKGVFDTVYYGLGSKCALNDILVKTPQNQDRLRTLGIGNTAPLTQLSSCGNTGYFKLYLETGCGFDIDPVANATLCQVFHDISEFITPVNSPSGTPAFVNILIKDPGRAHLDPAYLGVSSAFTAVPKLLPNQTGIADNQVWKTINSGVDAYSDAALPLIWLQYTQPLEFYHGSITFNLLPHNWQKDCALAPASAQYDLYNTLLHEVIHALGFESYMTPDGLSRMNYYVPGFTYYRRFDTYLETAGRDRLLVNSSGCGLQNWQANSAIAFAAPGSLMGGPLSPNCPSSLGYPPDETDCNTAIRYHTPSVDQAVYTPACFENGSSCSHFEDECLPIPLNNGYFVMSNVGPLGLIKHYLKSQERSVLCDLGYNVSGKYGQNPLLNPSNPAPVIDGYFDYGTTGCTSAKLVGRNDGINAQGEFEYHTQLNTATPLYIANFTGNDKLTLDNTLTPLSTADAAAAITVSCLEVIRGAGTITNFNGVNGGAFDYAPTRLGLHLLRYTPISGNLVGSIAYIFVWVDSDPASCAVSTNCDFIVNGNFESVQGDCGVVWDYQPSPAISCWNTLYGTPDVFSRTCGTVNYDIGYKFPTSALGGAPLAPDVWDGNLQNAHYIGLALIKKTGESYAEAVQTRLLMPLTAGEEYELRFKAKVDRGPYVNQIPNNIDAPLFFGLTENTLPVPVNTHYWPAYQPNIQVLQTTIIPNNGRWIDNTILFTCPAGANLRNFIIGYDIRQVPTSSKAYVLLDEISIHKVTDVLPVNAPVCMSLGATSDLTQLNTPNNITFTSSNNDLTIDANNHAIFTATAAGTHTIHYSYHIPPNNCIISDVKLINVSDDHVTITGGANQCAVFATQPLTASGGANYVWNTGEVGAAIQTTVSYSIYTVTATKCDGTTMTASITVVTNTALNIVGDGCISAQPNGATTLTADAPNAATISYAYLWSTGETTPQITAIAAGDYSVTVTDALNGCTAASSRAIGQTPTIQSLTATSSFISAGQTVTLTTTILPTTYPLYRWSTNVSGASLNSIDITAPGTYTVTVSNGTDALCSATASITITAPPSCVSPTNQLILGSNTPYPTIRDAITAQVIPAGTMTGGNIGIDGDLAINDNYYFDGVEINIGGGGSITVEKTVTFLSTNLAGLGCLWQGIDVQPNGKLIMKGCSISDAYRAVTATKGAVSLQNNSFDRNYVGLYSSNFFVLTYFSGNVFDCTGVLANPYPGITVGNWAYAGVEL
ncbi:MAG: hypothetical protein RI894_571, partial [Bacteroidota bacterium]